MLRQYKHDEEQHSCVSSVTQTVVKGVMCSNVGTPTAGLWTLARAYLNGLKYLRGDNFPLLIRFANWELVLSPKYHARCALC